jgi:hypothetical protein
MDWNWFFSSTAQSVAALVGVLGAFLVARLLADQSLFASDQARTQELARSGERLADAASRRYIAWYCERELDKALGRLKRKLEEADELQSAEEYYDAAGIPRFVPRAHALRKIEGALDNERERRGQPPSRSWLPDIGLLKDPALIAADRQELDTEREAIERLALEVKDNISAVEQHREHIGRQPQQTRIMSVLILALLLLFWVGVILPLTVLPVTTSDVTIPTSDGVVALKWAVLALAGVVFTGLLLTLRSLGMKLRHSDEELALLDSWTDPARYSPFFAECIENGYEL